MANILKAIALICIFGIQFSHNRTVSTTYNVKTTEKPIIKNAHSRTLPTTYNVKTTEKPMNNNRTVPTTYNVTTTEKPMNDNYDEKFLESLPPQERILFPLDEQGKISIRINHPKNMCQWSILIPETGQTIPLQKISSDCS